MTSKERMMTAIGGDKADRVPITIHQWQQYHLDKYMDGMDALSAFAAVGMDAAVQYFEAMGQFWIPDAERFVVQSPQWLEEIEVIDPSLDNKILHHRIATPQGELTYKTGGNRRTTWITEYLIKKHEDIDLVETYMPVPRLDKAKVSREYDRIGDAGILRGFVWGDQAGCWQQACCLMGTQELILEAVDNPAWVHRLMKILLDKKLQFISKSLDGAKFDIIETGGGAGSDTVISPKMFEEFCLPYDRRMHRALHDAGHKITYHTCGGMMNILDLIVRTEADASETLSPPGTGGNITDPAAVREAYAGRIAMIGGMDQFNVLTSGSEPEIRAEVRRLFEGFGCEGRYIMSTSDHFFETPAEKLRIFADEARECGY